MSRAPRFSVVIPTRNRAHLLGWSIRSALAQDFDDYEILVSNNRCVDGTDALVSSFDDPRIRYVKTGTALAMHDHWDFALEKARGDYALFLCDDDALLPDSLKILAAFFDGHPEVPCAVYTLGVFHHPFPPPDLEPNLLYVNPPDGSVLRPDPASALRELSAGCFCGDVPKMLNCAVSRQAIDGMRRRAGRVFFPNSPDFSFAAMVVLNRIDWIVLRETLLLWGHSSSSVGSMSLFKKSVAVRNFFAELGAEDPLEHAPVKVKLLAAYLASSFYAAANAMGIQVPLDRREHYLHLFRDLENLERRIGFTVERGRLRRVFSSEPRELQEEVLAELRRIRWGEYKYGRIPYFLRRLIVTSPLLRTFEKRIRLSLTKSRPAGVPALRGAEHGFTDILEAASLYRRLQREIYPTTAAARNADSMAVGSRAVSP